MTPLAAVVTALCVIILLMTTGAVLIHNPLLKQRAAEAEIRASRNEALATRYRQLLSKVYSDCYSHMPDPVAALITSEIESGLTTSERNTLPYE